MPQHVGYKKVPSNADSERLTPKNVNLLSLVTFQWLKDVFKTGSQRPLEQSDFLPLDEELTTSFATEQLLRLWEKEMKRCQGQTPKLWKCILRIVPLSHILLILSLQLLESICRAVVPLMMGFLVTGLMSNHDEKTEYLLYGCAASLALINIVKGLTMHQFSYQCELLGVKMCNAIKGIFYHKILLLSKQTLMEFTTGHVIDLVSNDVQRFELAPYWSFLVLQALFDFVAVTSLLSFLLGWQAITGVTFLVALFPFFILICSFNALIRRKTAQASDQRISLMNEAVSGLRAIKAHVWESVFREEIRNTRSQEISLIRMKAALLSTISVFRNSSGAVATFISIMTLVLTGQPVTPALAFMLLSFMHGLRGSISYNLAYGLLSLFETWVSLQRIEEFLLLGNQPLLTSSQSFVTSLEKFKTPKHQYSKDPTMALSVSHLTCQISDKYLLEDINFDASVKSLTALTGPIGSGKSTLLSSIAGEIPQTSGRVHVNGTIVLVPQMTWVFSGTIKENILFGKPYDNEIYRKVVDACALAKDIERFPEYDETVVGERGIVLSGGQRARMNLARAAYANADIILLDDPLSAVDFQVSQFIFNKCLVELLGDKTRVLVTHREEHMIKADQLIVLNKGCLQGRGKFETLKDNGSLGEIISLSSEKYSKKATLDSQFPLPVESKFLEQTLQTLFDKSQSKGLEKFDEDRAIGQVSWRFYWDYFTTKASLLVIIVVLIMFLLNQAISITGDVWLSYLTTKKWSEQRESATLAVYGSLVGTGAVFSFFRSYSFFSVSLRSSEHLHDKMVVSVIQAPVLFFDTTPIGRIMNRFSKDIGCLDEMLPDVFNFSLVNWVLVASIILVPAVVNPWLLLIDMPFIITCLYIARYYLKTSRELKRLESVCRSPVFSHISETLDGLDTIRTRGRQRDFIDQLYRFQDTHNQSFVMVVASTRWLGVRLDLLCACLSGAVAVASILISQNASLAGLTLAYVLQTIDTIQHAVRLVSEVEKFMTSVERVMTYTNLASEPGYKDERLPPRNWPSEGNISFKEVSLVYYQGGPQVLRNLNLSIGKKAKIGIVGRTGAGKSSFVAVVMRMPDVDGDIIIDGVKLKDINLKESRRCISVLGQTPVLFSRSIRKNLDPVGNLPDEVLWQALEDVQLKQLVRELDGELSYELLEQGSNLSFGERQLMCLARVLLQRNKIIILDEPTAHVDPKTEQTIWNTVRDKLADSTIITIAHRLNTVRDCDMILVFRDGMVVEFDTFDALLGKKGSVLTAIADVES